MKPRRTLIPDMLRVRAAAERLREQRQQDAYTSTALAEALGRRITHAEGVALRLIGWRRTIRRVGGRRVRAWLPPSPLHR